MCPQERDVAAHAAQLDRLILLAGKCIERATKVSDGEADMVQSFAHKLQCLARRPFFERLDELNGGVTGGGQVCQTHRSVGAHLVCDEAHPECRGVVLKRPVDASHQDANMVDASNIVCPDSIG